MDPELQAIIEELELDPHPEGGWYRRTWRGEPGPYGRPVGSAIYFAVSSDSPSRLHRVDAVELFHWYAGDEVEQLVIDPAGRIDVRRIGPGLSAARPQAIVPAGAWQGLHVPEPGRWALLGCTVTPAFEFDGFELVDDRTADELRRAHPGHAELIDRLR
jgi:predicted cupin superfamily sugar epimerase